MKKTKLTRSLMAACSIVALTAVMYGCVHSGGDGASTGGDTAMEDMMQTPAEQLAAAQTAVSDAEAAVAAATNATERAAAYGQLAAAEQMLADAEAIPENVLAALRQRLADAEDDLDDAEALRTAIDAVNAAEMAAGALDADSDQAAITAAMALVTAAQTAVDALGADDQARLQGQVDGADYMVMAAQTRLNNAVQVAADTKAAGTKAEAIAAEAEVAAGDDEGLGGTGEPTDSQVAGEYNLAIEYGETSITVEGTTEDDDEEFMLAMDLGGGRTMHTRTMDADDDGNVVTEVAIVATDIEAPTATAFGMVHTLDIRVDGEDATEAMPDDALNVVADNLAHVKADAFKAPAGTVGTTDLSFQQAVEDNDQTDEDESMDAAEIMGTYQGAMGTFKCNATAACTVTVDTMGVVSAVSNADDWIFIPASGATVDVDDTDYLHYGFWLQKTTDKDGVVTYDEVQTFADSSVDATGSVAQVTGSATYDGGATGVYVHSVTNSDGTEASATSGQFSADASLTATFGQVNNDATPPEGTIAPALLNTVSGTIDNFVLENDEQQAWAVNLQGDITENDGTAAGTANGGGAAGTFNATFHGPNVDADNDPIQPHSVVGEFDANFSNGSVAGAFGARKD